MKRVYWRPAGVSRPALGLVAALALLTLALVEKLPVQRQQPWYEEKLAATRLAQRASTDIRDEKRRRGLPFDKEVDPTDSGLIGEPITAVTANTGALPAKQRSVDPNFAAVLVHLLRRAHVETGDLVAVGVSGSFPALNVATFAALSVVGARPVVIASASASEWGANHVDYLWIDMEKTLLDHGTFAFRSIASSRGGIDDRGYGISKEGRQFLDAAIERNQLERIEPRSLVDSIDKRIVIWDREAGGRAYKAYINVGGGSASVGTHVGKKQFKPGLNLEVPSGERLMDSVMLRFAKRDVPVIHVTDIEALAKTYGLEKPRDGVYTVGVGSVYARADYNRWLAGGGLLVLLVALLAFTRLDVGFRFLRGEGSRKDGGSQPQQMV